MCSKTIQVLCNLPDDTGNLHACIATALYGKKVPNVVVRLPFAMVALQTSNYVDGSPKDPGLMMRRFQL